MRLERIRVISEDAKFDPELANIFAQILKDEEFHERAFKELTNEKLYEKHRVNHEKGAESIGLVA